MLNNSLNIVLEENGLTKTNYVNWLKNLRIILNLEQIPYIFKANILTSPPHKGLGGVSKRKGKARAICASESSKERGVSIVTRPIIGKGTAHC